MFTKKVLQIILHVAASTGATHWGEQKGWSEIYLAWKILYYQAKCISNVKHIDIYLV